MHRKSEARACKVMGYSRDTFYRYKAAKEEGGIEALFDANRRKPNLKNRADERTEQHVIGGLVAMEQKICIRII